MCYLCRVKVELCAFFTGYRVAKLPVQGDVRILVYRPLSSNVESTETCLYSIPHVSFIIPLNQQQKTSTVAHMIMDF